MNILKYLTIRNYKQAKNREIKFIVIHYVGAVSSAIANAKYFYSTYRGASAHYFVDDTQIVQVVDDANISWHCGDTLKKGNGGKFNKICTNSNSIGIEMCCIKNGNKLDISDKTINNTMELVKQLKAKYGVSDDHIIRHFDVTNKVCPAPMVENPTRWEQFKAKINSPKTDGKYEVGDFVETNIPVQIAFSGEKCLVDSNGYQFWVHKSVIKNNCIIARAEVMKYLYANVYELKIFDDKFACRTEYITKKL